MRLVLLLLTVVGWLASAQLAVAEDPFGDARRASPKQIAFEVLIAEQTVADARPDGAADELKSLDILKHIHQKPFASIVRVPLVTLDQQQTRAQFQERIPIVTGRTIRGRDDSFAEQVQYENVGLTVGVTARVEESGDIIAEVSVERTQAVRPPANADAQTEPRFVPTKITSFQTQSTVRITNAQPVVMTGRRTRENDQVVETYILVTAKVLEAKPRQPVPPIEPTSFEEK